MDAAQLRKLADVYRVLAKAQEALDQCPKSLTDVSAVEAVTAEKQYEDEVTSARNVVLAGSGVKAELIGTLYTAPTATDGYLVSAGLDEKTEDVLLALAAEIRNKALALDTKPPAAMAISISE